MGEWNKNYTVWVRKEKDKYDTCHPIGTVEARGIKEAERKAENLCKVTGYKLHKIVRAN